MFTFLKILSGDSLSSLVILGLPIVLKYLLTKLFPRIPIYYMEGAFNDFWWSIYYSFEPLKSLKSWARDITCLLVLFLAGVLDLYFYIYLSTDLLSCVKLFLTDIGSLCWIFLISLSMRLSVPVETSMLDFLNSWALVYFSVSCLVDWP